MLTSLFITGTDTDVGKTFVGCELIRELRRRSHRVAGLKPIECGGRNDSQQLLEASGDETLTLDQVNPVHFELPIAPDSATAFEGGTAIDWDQIRGARESLLADYDSVIVEGAGGWLVPLDDTKTVADLAVEFGAPVLVVAANRLGVLNHTALTLNQIRRDGCEILGLYLNQIPTADAEDDVSMRSNERALRRMHPEVRLFTSVDQVCEAMG